MTFDESLAWLYSTQQFGIKLGLENIRRLLTALGEPQERLSFFHVAGTNGKGSVCAMLDSVLRAAGHRTGLYTSPHLVDFRERVRVDGKKIPPEAVAEGLTKIRQLSSGWEHSPTFFEIATALALWHFAQEECAYVVLETGMGGRLDATNAVVPLVSVITPIALDHSQWLGDTLAKIAAEKAGIIKPGIPVVSASQEPEVAQVLKEKAEASAIWFVEAPLQGWEIGLRGAHQRENAALVLAALEASGVPMDEHALKEGLRTVHWPGRFQIIDGRLVLDGGHNPHAAAHLVETWRAVFGARKPVVIFGALADKDYAAMLRILEPLAERFYFVPVRSQRAVIPETLAAVSQGEHLVFPSVREALAAAEGLILITGSLFLIGEALEAFGET